MMILPKLRGDLDVSPSPDPENPGILVRDRYRFTAAWLIIPALLVQGLKYFNGAHTDQDLAIELSRLTGLPDTAEIAHNLINALDTSGFLENDTFTRMRESCYRDFAESPVRKAQFAGSGYPSSAGEIGSVWQNYLAGPSPSTQGGVLGIAAPHVTPSGGWQSYGAAYRSLTPDLHDRTFIILGTSHYGQGNRFGLTRKPFETPLGITRTDTALLDTLAAQPAVNMEDYCEVIEHSIEFQVLFLQHLYGPDVKILPLLCGHFAQSIIHGGKPEDDDLVRRFFGTLGDIAAREADRLFWVMGVDLAHIGSRYGDSFAAHAEQDEMLRVKERDMQRIASLNAGDSDTFWAQVQEHHDDLRWCGSSPLYTFMQIMPNARGTLQHYEQWNIDAQSVVSMAGISFAAAS